MPRGAAVTLPHADMKPVRRILLVDDHAFVRRAVRRLLELEPDLRVCAEVSTREQALKSARAQHPDLIVLDLSLEEENGLTVAEDLRAQLGDIPILILTEHKETIYAESALRAGADGYVMKSDASENLVVAVRTVLNRDVYVSPLMRQLIFSRLRGWDGDAEQPTQQQPRPRRVVRRSPFRRPKVRSSGR